MDKAFRPYLPYGNSMHARLSCFALLAAALVAPTLRAQDPPARINARLMQMPAVSQDRIAFVYAGDIWIAPKEGGQAIRLSSPRGVEQFPRFSPDGSKIAFSGNYEGNT